MSGVLLDTHALIWLMQGNSALGSRTRAFVREARLADGVSVSAVSFWEIAMLAARGRVSLGQPVIAWRRQVLESGILEVPLSGLLGIIAAELDGLPRDPADRFVTATALEEGATLVTADARLLGWPGTLARHDART